MLRTIPKALFYIISVLFLLAMLFVFFRNPSDDFLVENWNKKTLKSLNPLHVTMSDMISEELFRIPKNALNELLNAPEVTDKKYVELLKLQSELDSLEHVITSTPLNGPKYFDKLSSLRNKIFNIYILFGKTKYIKKLKSIKLLTNFELVNGINENKIALSDEIMENMKGKVVYKVQDSMEVNKISRVLLTIRDSFNLKTSLNKITEALKSKKNPLERTQNNVKMEDIIIGQKMRAKLIDPQSPNITAFNISSLSNEIQLVDLKSKHPSSWQWDVYPLKKGSYMLNLIVEIIVLKEGIESPISIPVFEKQFVIYSTTDNVKFSDTLPWLSMLIALIGILYLSALRFISPSKLRTPFYGYGKDFIKAPIGTRKFEYDKFFTLIKKDKTEKALDMLDDYSGEVDREINRLVIIQKSNLSRIKYSYSLGTMSDEDYRQGRTKINQALISIIFEELRPEGG